MEQLDQIFKALSDPTRRQQVKHLTRGPATISDLAAPFDMTLPAASKHLKILERAKIVTCEKVGRAHICKLNPQTLSLVDEWLSFYRPFWEAKLDNLEAFLGSAGAEDKDASK
ncbi:ArsR/SmtB family transcription factor [Martelella radicis]|uniref:DNA-binding transcriptional ArsR family regulator n=1 Tax=Martelella radicis TaxID=1397476 RepID=A0A7W6KIU2_9HYPH|nr:metalloregulator ArsR/SmtB family transcription factor [Martelella radicis]MBB4121009.1 DNA-binding transcriptional ArsR family regulator [Martelella radicis]